MKKKERLFLFFVILILFLVFLGSYFSNQFYFSPEDGNFIRAVYLDEKTGEAVNLLGEENNYLEDFVFETEDLVGVLDVDVNFFHDDFIEDFSEEVKEYIVEFEEPPLLEKRAVILKQKKKTGVLQNFNSEQDVLMKNEIENSLEGYKNKFLEKQEEDKENLFQELVSFRSGKGLMSPSLKSQEEIFKQEFRGVLNGVVVDATLEEVEKLEKLDFVKKIHESYEVHAFLEESVHMINASLLWDVGVKGDGVTIGIIDTGIDYTHPAFGSCSEYDFLSGDCERVVGGYDFVNNDEDPIDDHYHGTHCAGIAAGNGGGVVGVAPNAKLYAYKVLSSSGAGSSSGVIAAIERSMDPNQDGDYSDHLDVISLSLGSAGANPDDAGSLALDRAMDNGVVAVVAAGNDGPRKMTIATPGASRKAITVASATKEYETSGFSSRGPLIWQDKDLDKPDISAPGSYIVSATLNGGLKTASGTSMATPHVAGAVALLKQLFPGWTPLEIKERIKETAFDMGEEKDSQGAGLLDLAAASAIVEGRVKAIVSPYGKKIKIIPKTQIVENSETYFVENILDEELILDVSVVMDSFEGLQVSVTKSNLVLAPGELENFDLVFEVDVDVIQEKIYEGVVFFEDVDSDYEYSVPFKIEIEPMIAFSETEISLGAFSPTEDSWSLSYEFSVKNKREDASLSYDAFIEILGYSELPGGELLEIPIDISDSFSLSDYSVDLESSEEKDLVFSVNFEDAPLPEGFYYGRIVLSSEKETGSLDFSFIRKHGLKFTEAEFAGAFDPIWLCIQGQESWCTNNLYFPKEVYVGESKDYSLVIYGVYYSAEGERQLVDFVKKDVFVEGMTEIEFDINDCDNFLSVALEDVGGNLLKQGGGSVHVNSIPEIPSAMWALIGGRGWGVRRFNDIFEGSYFYTVLLYEGPEHDSAYFVTREISDLTQSYSLEVSDFSEYFPTEIIYNFYDLEGKEIEDGLAMKHGGTEMGVAGRSQKEFFDGESRTLYSLDNSKILPGRFSTRLPTANLLDASNYRSADLQIVEGKLVKTESRLLSHENIFLEGSEDFSVSPLLGPEIWFGELYVEEDGLFAKIRSRDMSMVVPFRTQEMSKKDQEGIIFELKNQEGEIILKGELPSYYDRGTTPDPVCPCGRLYLPEKQKYTLSVSREYSIGADDYKGVAELFFDNSKTDKIPPSFSFVKILCDDSPCEILEAGLEKKLIVKPNAQGGSIVSYKISYFDGVGWTDLGSVNTEGVYETLIPDVGEDLIKLKIFVKDNSQNSLSYIFEIPTNFYEFGSVNDCMELNQDGTLYSLTQDIFADETCISITGEDIVLDCKENFIYYGGLNPGESVMKIFDAKNILLKNCFIREKNNENYFYGIYAENVDGLEVEGLDLRTELSGGAGIYITENSFVEISESYVETKGAGSHAVYLDSGKNILNFSESTLTSEGNSAFDLFVNNLVEEGEINFVNVFYDDLNFKKGYDAVFNIWAELSVFVSNKVGEPISGAVVKLLGQEEVLSQDVSSTTGNALVSALVYSKNNLQEIDYNPFVVEVQAASYKQAQEEETFYFPKYKTIELEQDIAACGAIFPGNYTLSEDIYSDKGCFEIKYSGDYEIDCQGHRIVYNTGGFENVNGIFKKEGNLILKNCEIVEEKAGKGVVSAIRLSVLGKSFLINNTIILKSNYSKGIYLSGGFEEMVIDKNKIYVFGERSSGIRSELKEYEEGDVALKILNNEIYLNENKEQGIKFDKFQALGSENGKNVFLLNNSINLLGGGLRQTGIYFVFEMNNVFFNKLFVISDFPNDAGHKSFEFGGTYLNISFVDSILKTSYLGYFKSRSGKGGGEYNFINTSFESNRGFYFGDDLNLSLEIFFYLNVFVKNSEGEGIPNSNVRIYNKDDELVYEGETDILGKVGFVVLVNESNSEGLIYDANPYEVLITKQGYDEYRKGIVVDENKNLVVDLETGQVTCDYDGVCDAENGETIENCEDCECDIAEDCGDLDFCTNDFCLDGKCFYEAVECVEDSLECTVAYCDSGKPNANGNYCVFDISDCECNVDEDCPDDGNLATKEFCLSGKCQAIKGFIFDEEVSVSIRDWIDGGNFFSEIYEGIKNFFKSIF